MKRTIKFMTSGKSVKGHDWYMLVFHCALQDGVLYRESTEFVSKDIYDAVAVGATLEIR